jgi:hypothetical protein
MQPMSYGPSQGHGLDAASQKESEEEQTMTTDRKTGGGAGGGSKGGGREGDAGSRGGGNTGPEATNPNRVMFVGDSKPDFGNKTTDWNKLGRARPGGLILTPAAYFFGFLGVANILSYLALSDQSAQRIMGALKGRRHSADNIERSGSYNFHDQIN